MSNKKFWLITLLQVVLITAAKVYFFRAFTFENPLDFYIFWAITSIVNIALVRRLGVINFLEALFICAVWLIVDGFIDLILTSGLVGLQIFLHWPLWTGYIALFLAVFLGHKKKHLHIRHEQHAGRFIRH